MKLLLVLVAVGVASAALAGGNMLLDILNVQSHMAKWEDFKKAYQKAYTGVEEEMKRFNVFVSNSLLIDQHNREEAQDGRHGFTLAVNEFADLTNDEFVKLYNNYKPKPSTGENPIFLEPENVELPAEVDWRKKGYVTGVKNQGQCGSCWAFSATGSLEGQHFKKTKKLVSLSEQNLVDCSGNFGNEGCNGGWMDQAFEYIKSNNGIDTEASYPYTARDGTCHFNKANVGATVAGHTDIPSKNEKALQKAAATVGPISVAIDASHISFQFYSNGVYNEQSCSQTQLDHGVLVVGYGTDNGKDYWLVKNSWGGSWGMKGYIMMSRNKNNQCGIATVASYPLV